MSWDRKGMREAQRWGSMPAPQTMVGTQGDQLYVEWLRTAAAHLNQDWTWRVHELHGRFNYWNERHSQQWIDLGGEA